MPGAADRSYGIQVARLAGLPLSVIDRAKTILTQLESDEVTVTLAAEGGQVATRYFVIPDEAPVDLGALAIDLGSFMALLSLGVAAVIASAAGYALGDGEWWAVGAGACARPSWWSV